MQSLFSSAQLLSLVLFVSLSHVGVAAIFAYLWHTQRPLRALLYWSASELAIAAAFGCLLLRPLTGETSLANILLTNLLIIVTPLLYERGLRHFFRREADRFGWLCPLLALAGFLLFALVASQQPLADVHSRIITLSGVLSLQIGLLLWQLWRYQRLAPAYRVLRFAILLLALQLALQLLRMAKHQWWPESAASSLTDPLLGPVILLSLLFTIARSFILLSLVHTRQQQAMLATQRELERRANQDALTGLDSRHHFEQQLAARACRSARPWQLLLIDLDNFKQINDRHGHPAGDAMLRAVGRVIRESLPPAALAGRLGGDELALLVMETPQTLPGYCHALQQGVTEATRPLAGGPIGLSMGLTSLQTGESFEQAYLRADQALYAAKQSGRMRACIREAHHSEPRLLQAAELHP
ncbi:MULTISPECIES: GGDEF domain-containing protein [Aeromonas]|uniref:GGDEF domain-containing protein n=1 Tax=Aeromonas TaxID=642 RepID=UPI0007ED13A6|nr:GGDEF domain-containing protein [Aeromonas dhakensis]OBR45327.1 diguanylate cyclase [Aeromonas dhakensis]